MFNTTVLCVLITLICLEIIQAQNHKISKRFVYPNNAIVQFALGLSLPAEVKGRGIATNSGILININLPTNLTEFSLVPELFVARSKQLNFLRKINNAIERSNLHNECIWERICTLSKSLQAQDNLYLNLVLTFLKHLYLNKQENNNTVTEDFLMRTLAETKNCVKFCKMSWSDIFYKLMI